MVSERLDNQHSVIDTHMHIGYKDVDAETIIAYLDTYNVEKCWLLTWEESTPIHPEEYIHLSIEDVLETCKKYPSRIIPMYAPDPREPDFEDKMIRCHKKGVRGCGELKVPLSWNSYEIGRLLTCIRNLKIPLIFHMEEAREIRYPVSSFLDRLLVNLFTKSVLFGQPRQIFNLMTNIFPWLKSRRERILWHFPGYLPDFNYLEKRLIEYPDVTFIGHGPLFWKGLSADWSSEPMLYPDSKIIKQGILCRLLSDYDNLYGDISGMSGFNALNRDHTFAQQFLTCYSHKILYGTDNWRLGLKDFLCSLDLSQTSYNNIVYENAAKIMEKAGKYVEIS